MGKVACAHLMEKISQLVFAEFAGLD